MTKAKSAKKYIPPIRSFEEHVGGRIRLRREALDLTPRQVATRIGVSVPQYRSLERGGGQIKAIHLFRISCVLGVPVNFFFADLPDAMEGVLFKEGTSWLPQAQDLLDAMREREDPMFLRKTWELLTAFQSLEPGLQSHVISMAWNLAERNERQREKVDLSLSQGARLAAICS